MKCPYCGIEFYMESYGTIANSIESDEHENWAEGFIQTQCPNCEEYSLFYVQGEYYTNDDPMNFIDGIREPYHKIKLLYPQTSVGRILSSYVPNEYKDDFEESSRVLDISPKASAALSRRCLQRFLHNRMKIKKKNLAQEIQVFLDEESLPSYLSEAVDAIRSIGNFAAHPLKNTNTGEIIDVEPGEAEWLLEVLELIFDFYFVQPEKLKARKDALNQKLTSAGKKPITI